MFNQVITTLDTYKGTETEGGIIVHKNGEVKEFQKVIALGPMATKNISVGEMVYINPARYAKRKFKEGTLREDNVQEMNPILGYAFNIININGQDCLKLYDTDIEYVIEEMEEVEDDVSNKLILPKTKKIII